jgi:Flp pilus assembly protein TadB
MVCMPFGSLWLPVLVSAALVWITSAIVWMALPHHKSDFSKLPQEEGVADALRKFGLKPGQYVLPYMQEMKNMKDPAVVKRFEDGPVAMMIVRPNGVPGMGKNLVQYFLYCFLVSFMTAYVARHTLSVTTAKFDVFHITGTVAILGYALAVIPESIWMWRKWSMTVKSLCDSIAYGLITGAVFAFLWPHG